MKTGKRNTVAVIIALACFCQCAMAQVTTYSIDLNTPPLVIDSTRLQLGGSNTKGDQIAVNSYYLSFNHSPVIPITGEFHYIRYPREYWEDAILKMKAGGITMIATYVFWNVHEEKEGVFDWKGNKDLRAFIQLCAANKMQVVLRVGPFCHGEIRNGGLPDWTLGKPWSVRSNDEGYLKAVETLYNEIGKQVQGLFFKDGGPIVAVQVENEYQHSAAPWGLTYPDQPYDWTSAARDKEQIHEGVSIAQQKNPYAALGNDHMKILKALIIKAGMEAPIYTVTGWGNAAVIENESLPVTGAYPYPTWVPKPTLSPSYLYRDLHKVPEYAPVRYKPEDYPVFCAELGGGIMVTYKRRPLVPAESMDALVNRFIGSGANGLGYYMFLGGSTPRGEQSYYSDEAYGYPKISYDFQAPIREFGQLGESYYRLKLIHFFLNSFGNLLAPMQTVLPAGNDTLQPNNLQTLRYAAREKNGGGFLFLNNFQDHAETKDKNNIQLQVKTPQGNITIPETGTIGIKAGENAILPVNIDIEGIHFNYATAQLLTKLDNKEKTLVFFAPEGMNAEFSFPGNVTVQNLVNSNINKNEQRVLVKKGSNIDDPVLFTITHRKATIRILVIDRLYALLSWLIQIGNVQHIAISTGTAVIEKKGQLEIYRKGDSSSFLMIYPATNRIASSAIVTNAKQKDSAFLSIFKIKLPGFKITDTVTSINDQKIQLSLTPNWPPYVNDVFAKVDYVADNGMAFINGELVADEFYKGRPWEIGLKKFMIDKQPKNMVLYFRPIYKDAPWLVDFPADKQPDFSKTKSFTHIQKITFTPEYKAVIPIQ